MTPETPCASCGGAAHDASGRRYSARTIVCGRCVRAFWAWVRVHTKPRKGTDFYGAATVWTQPPTAGPDTGACT